MVTTVTSNDDRWGKADGLTNPTSITMDDDGETNWWRIQFQSRFRVQYNHPESQFPGWRFTPYELPSVDEWRHTIGRFAIDELTPRFTIHERRMSINDNIRFTAYELMATVTITIANYELTMRYTIDYPLYNWLSPIYIQLTLPIYGLTTTISLTHCRCPHELTITVEGWTDELLTNSWPNYEVPSVNQRRYTIYGLQIDGDGDDYDRVFRFVDWQLQFIIDPSPGVGVTVFSVVWEQGRD